MGRLILLCVTALLACGVYATEQGAPAFGRRGLVERAERGAAVFQNVSVSLLEQGAYLDIPFPFAVTVQLQADMFDPSPADCDPDCRTIYISGFPLEVPKPFPDAELLTHMRATLRGIPCTYNALCAQFSHPNSLNGG